MRYGPSGRQRSRAAPLRAPPANSLNAPCSLTVTFAIPARSLGSSVGTLPSSMKTSFLGDAASRDAQKVGAKAATLSRLADRFRVPAGFCLDASVFDELGPALEGDRKARATLRAIVDAGHQELERLTGRSGPAVAVRSSAIGEGGSESAFRGA